MMYLVFCFMSFALGAFFLSAPDKLKLFIMGLIVSGVIASIYSFCQYFAFIPWFEPNFWPIRITGLFSNKNACALFIMNSGIWTTYLIFSIKNKKLSAMLFAALIIQMVALFIAESRGVSLLSMVGFCAVFVPLAFRSGYLKSAKVRYLLYAVFSLCMLVHYLSGMKLHGSGWQARQSKAIPFVGVYTKRNGNCFCITRFSGAA